MLQIRPRNTVFVFTIYNKTVRALVKENKSHFFFEDHWADDHVQDVEARDEAEAIAVIQGRFPPEDGFIIAAISERR
ncbi:hypothetical protein EDD55_10872 [Varunaivibrio sulfuroxidans]|uniref:Uncharacterized protein n=1 Tax=Varunaivibrio sulfuroxidans TaxID=1773489 RepID=A0A4R3J8M6_9PROT|nr:hypothetical protein EDD55_10872 [Varunaivibrio sulfuroxidans]